MASHKKDKQKHSFMAYGFNMPLTAGQDLNGGHVTCLMQGFKRKKNYWVGFMNTRIWQRLD
ncbi:hypothetical protein HanRHA438_Chr15g0693321 [Helianthus annuus]|nr:hypothetical protein HanIR_Chr15g0739721 [Helianthus annuus]KAJ0843625.1 hypothetical protein HanRHA438_Chr15g0693321 [Helianthus annuus]